MRKFNEAIQVAQSSTMAQMHGAVIVRGGKTIKSACNSLKPIHYYQFGLWSHAEVAAIVSDYRSDRSHVGSDVFVVRIKYNEDGSIRTLNSKPCAHCCKALEVLGIRRVYYTTDDGLYVVCKVNELVPDHVSIANKNNKRH
jgi:tRNA(Arg) A34 adenosine deaminase TadA